MAIIINVTATTMMPIVLAMARLLKTMTMDMDAAEITTNLVCDCKCSHDDGCDKKCDHYYCCGLLLYFCATIASPFIFVVQLSDWMSTTP